MYLLQQQLFWFREPRIMGNIPGVFSGVSWTAQSELWFCFSLCENHLDMELNRINHHIWLQRALLLSKIYIVLI